MASSSGNSSSSGGSPHKAFNDVLALYEGINSAYERFMGIGSQVADLEYVSTQLVHFLKYAERHIHGFVGSREHLEAEKMLLITNTKVKAIMQVQESANFGYNQAKAELTIENIRCCIRTAHPHNPIPPKDNSYYILVLQHDNTVHATTMAKTDLLGYVEFGGFYIFREIKSSFAIKGQLYILNLDPVLRSGFKRFFSRKYKMPLAKLIGSNEINMKNVGNIMLKFQHVDGVRFYSDRLIPSVFISLQWPEKHKAYLTMGFVRPNEKMTFDRRWCVLQKNELSYYISPSEEANGGAAVGTISLKECISCEEDIKIYPGKLALKLKFESYLTEKIIYAIPETQYDICVWRQKFVFVINTMTNWKINSLF